ncbi:MAG: PD-(D/E)XK nuclease family protein [Acidobacteriota bacterium]|nr:PD-(D/E)XK nuclease family protein [Acidobacteriota bacterium]
MIESFTAQQRLQGKSVWKSPDILPWGAFLNRLWREWLVSADSPGLLLLSPDQELTVWEQVVRESPEGQDLLRIPETAAKVMEAWHLLHAYCLPLRAGQFGASQDCAAFANWAREFERRLEKSGWLEPARLPDVLAELLRSAKVRAPQHIVLAGFDEFTPQQKAFLDVIGGTREFSLPSVDAACVTLALRDSADELRTAAAWARDHLERNPEAQIGVILPNLDRLRAQAERVFTAVFHPGLTPGAGSRAFHISMGVPLIDVPLVRAAFNILEWAVGALPSPQVGMLLRSPFLAGAERERSARALLDAKLRKRGFFRLTTKTVREQADACPMLDSALRHFQKELDQLPSEQNPSQWSRSFAHLLKVAGWPGDRTLSSHEFQAGRAWNDLLSRFATLDAVARSLPFEQALDQLQQLAETSVFQPEDLGARVQVMGLFESSGLRFDHLWVMGLHDEALPRPARPNPFLPLDLQKAHSLPRSSAARELEVGSMLMRRLRTSAPEVVFSYPKQEGDQHLGPSPFLSEIESAPAPRPVPTWLDSMKSSARMEAVADPIAPPVPADVMHLGGTWLLRDMAACYFRAWALNRAGARPLEEPEAGISSRESGTAVHTALQLIWEKVQTHAALCSLTELETDQIIASSVRAGVAKTKGLGRALEQRRLQELLFTWLQKEKQRQPFRVIESEAEHVIILGGLQIKTRFDRVDQLVDGRHVVLDYKTGVLKPGIWSGDRPDEPQLPLYCISDSSPIAAAAFAQIRCGDIGFKGLEEEPHILPDLGKMEKGAVLSRQITEWRRVLETLAADFCAGQAQVNPKRHACDFCSVTALCRVQDVCLEDAGD